jgi:hypothetical protein
LDVLIASWTYIDNVYDEKNQTAVLAACQSQGFTPTPCFVGGGCMKTIHHQEQD